MPDDTPVDPPAPSWFDQISTRWAQLQDPRQFIVRYGPAIRKYLLALLKDADDVQELSQDIVLRMMQGGFAKATPDRGRFRDYLKVAVRNAAFSFLRRKRPVLVEESMLMDVPDAASASADEEWLAGWQRCALAKAWRTLERKQRTSPGNLFFTVLQLSMEHGAEEDSTALAERASEQSGRPINAAAFRKQLSRARDLFATVLVNEAAETLEEPTRDQVQEELIEVGLWPFVRDYFPEIWDERDTA